MLLIQRGHISAPAAMGSLWEGLAASLLEPGPGPGPGPLDLGVGLGMRPVSGPGSGSGPGLGPVLTLLVVVFSAYCVLGLDLLEQLGWSSLESSQRVSFGSGKSG